MKHDALTGYNESLKIATHASVQKQAVAGHVAKAALAFSAALMSA